MRLQITMRAARTNAGLTQADVATALGVSKTTVAKWENNKGIPLADKFVAFCELVQMSPSLIVLPESCPKDNYEE